VLVYNRYPIKLYVSNGKDPNLIMKETEIKAKDKVIDFYNFFRDLTQGWAQRVQTNEKLGGLGVVVEIDEIKYFKAKYNRGCMLNRQYRCSGY
jgi:hypothetical protein